MAIATETQLQNIQQAFQRLIFRIAVLPERPCISTGKRTLHKIDMLLGGQRHQLQPHLFTPNARYLCREDIFLLAAFEQ